MDSMMSFTYFPIRFIATVGMLFSLFSLVGIMMVIREKIVVGTPILGYASIMCVLLLGFGLAFIMLAVLGEYIWRTLEESRKRPPFIIDTIKKNDN